MKSSYFWSNYREIMFNLFHFPPPTSQTPSIYWAFDVEQTLEQTVHLCSTVLYLLFHQLFYQGKSFFLFRGAGESNPRLAWTTYFPRGFVCLYRFVTIGSFNIYFVYHWLQFGCCFYTLFIVCITG